MPNLSGHPVAWSPCKSYRYTLWRTWGDASRYVQFVGLNPSTADETNDDPTVRRCIGYAKAWGYGAMCMTNLFAYRATDPRVMRAQNQPVGDRNDFWLSEVASNAALVIACWGCHGQLYERDREVLELLHEAGAVHCLRLTKGGIPGHPLYLPASLKPVELEPCP